jgi:hypothetical protein
VSVRVLSARCAASGASGPEDQTTVRLSLDVSPDDQGEGGPITLQICLIDRRGAPVYGMAETRGVAERTGTLEVDVPVQPLKDGVYACYVLARLSGHRYEGGPVELEVSHGNA